MRPIVNSEEMKFCDSNTIGHFGIPSMVLMERAALSVVEQIPQEVLQSGRILAVCGNGNNGADGLAIARLLYQRGCLVEIVQMNGQGKRSEENMLQRKILQQYGIRILDEIAQSGAQAAGYSCVIDALFGVGLSREPQGEYAAWIHAMNELCGYKVAVDMPSGVSSDTGEAYEASFDADLTVTFAYQKIGQAFYPGRAKCGKLVIADIGITDESWMGRAPCMYAFGKEDLKCLPYRPDYSNKGTFGKVLVIAGSAGMAGAALFCAQAAYCSGCGLVKIYTPTENRTVLQSALPEAVLLTYDSSSPNQDALLDALAWADAVAVGPGLGTGGQARMIVELVLIHAKVPVVLDADALNILAGHTELFKQAKTELIITPHLGEMARLCQQSVPQLQKGLAKAAKEFASHYHLVCVLKDAVTVTAVRDTAVYLNLSGCNAMAKGGSGDVLTGIIAGLLAQEMPVGDAAVLGTYVHGLAGEAAAEEYGPYSVMAGDIIAMIGRIMR